MSRVFLLGFMAEFYESHIQLTEVFLDSITLKMPKRNGSSKVKERILLTERQSV